MPLTVHGYLPTSGEAGRFLDHIAAAPNARSGVSRSAAAVGSSYRPATLDFLTEIAQAAEAVGYDSVLVPTGHTCEDAWITASALMTRTSRLRFMVAFRPGLVTPVLAAQMVATYQRFSGGRLTLNVTPGVPGATAERYGDWRDKAERLEQAGEFLTIMRGAWSGEPFTFEGRHHHVREASVAPFAPAPTVYYGGSSELSMQFAARHADVYLSYVEPLEMTRQRLDHVRALAAEHGRTVRCALSFSVLSRETSEEAWAAADAMLDGVDPQTIEDARAIFAKAGVNASAARTRLMGVLSDTSGRAEVAPNLWIGPMLVRSGAAPALVGSHEEVADRIEELVGIGCDEIEMGGAPNLESILSFGTHVMPILRARGIVADEAAAGVAG
ncbi:alkanesulfonate monooxygenase [Pseudonocardia sulfidoxydans NBRC 16205]|uniref:Alkanesulfonate monooxygenase n=1 Tax=Pseudonocardia sulfidoxydans NBRC 16205 TaxID=1223511 RepID=A0A511DQK1_9PSEU|nr:LLM class flavin-dependent oxidoreductase [Pseudonocardia sulfidoxydans]GEL27105.1 alkanesulfonate monooxygenase [Pseudonocardia sulfidoxydans NBRC 16205]